MPHVVAVVEQFWHRLPGGTARSTERTLAALHDSGRFAITGVAARHRSRDNGPARRMPPSSNLVHHRLPRPALYESWLRSGRPSVDRWCRENTVVWASSLIVPPTSRPVLATVHDLDFLRQPEYLTPRGRQFFPLMWRVARERADRFVCPSTVVADDVAGQGIDRARIDVVPWGVDPPRCSSADSQTVLNGLGLDPGYVLVVAGMTPRKNPEGIVEAIAAVDCRAVLVGAASDDPRIEAALHSLGGRVTRLGDVDDVTLSALYRGADVLLYPSHREGFGLPVLEAMVHDTAVITAGGTATEEVAAGAAVLVDPTDRPGIAEALDRVLADDALRRDLVARGRARAGSMTWGRTGKGYGAIIDRLATGVGVGRSTV